MKFGKNAAHGGAKRSLVLVVSVLALVLAVAGGTLAWLTANSGPVTNTFTPAQVTCEVDETFQNNVKSAVSIKNTSNIDAYIRAYVVVTWKDAQGNVYGKPVKDTDYTIEYATGTGWEKGSDGYYYFTKPVGVDKTTSELIKTCAPVADKAPAGYDLSVEIIAEAIQSLPATTVASVWPVTVDANGALAPKSGN